MIVKNHTEQDIYMVFEGTRYDIPAKGELANVPKAVAMHWQNNVHQFVTLSEDKKAEVAEAKVAEVKKEAALVVPEAIVVPEVVAEAAAAIVDEVKTEETKTPAKVVAPKTK